MSQILQDDEVDVCQMCQQAKTDVVPRTFTIPLVGKTEIPICKSCVRKLATDP